MLTIETECFLCKGKVIHIHEFFGHRFGLGEVDFKAIEFIGLITAADTQDQPATADCIGHADFRKQTRRRV